MSAADRAKAEVIAVLLEAGFVPDGEAGYTTSYLRTFNGACEWARTNSRARLRKEGSDVKATVGARTTALYRVTGPGLDGVRGIASLDTKDLSAIRTAVAGISALD